MKEHPAGLVGESIERGVLELVSSSGIPVVSLAIRDLLLGGEILINPDASLHAASTMKTPVMAEVFRQASRGTFSLNDEILVRNQFQSLLDGSVYSLQPDDDSDKSLYDAIGQPRSIRHLVELMIQQSGNLATNLLIDVVGAGAVTEFMIELGVPGLVVLRGVEDGPAYRAGLNNTATARSLMKLFERLAAGAVVSASASKEMIAILAGQRHNEAIPERLRQAFTFAHKTGWNADLYHDSGVVLEGGTATLAFAVLTKGSVRKELAQELIQRILLLMLEPHIKRA